MKFTYDIAIIGGGSAGLVVAAGAAAMGAKAVLFEAALMGGDCLNYGCVPSKSFLHGAHIASELKTCENQGIYLDDYKTDIVKLMQYVHSVIEKIAPHDSVERFEALGVKVVQEFAAIKDRHTIVANGVEYTAKSIVIASGSTAFIPPIKGIETVPYYTNHNIFDIKQNPKSLAVIGAGPIGLELGQGFAHMGTKVTVINQSNGIFQKDEPEVDAIMQKVLKDDGIEFCLNSKVISVQKNGEDIDVNLQINGETKTITCSALLVSTGRKPVTDNMNLQENGVQLTNKGAVIVNDKLQSTVSNIYACGDSAGPYLFTHMASYQASIVLQNALFGLSAKAEYRSVPWCTYTKPEVAHVGYLQEDAKKAGKDIKTVHINFKENDRALAENDTHGFLKLVLDKKGIVIGATLVGNKAGEMLSLACLAVQNKLNINVFNSVIFPYPTQSEIYKAAASKYRKENVKTWQFKLLKNIIKRRNN